MKKTSVDLPTDLYRDLKIYSINNGLKMRDVISMAITCFLKKGIVEDLTLRQLLNDIFKEL